MHEEGRGHPPVFAKIYQADCNFRLREKYSVSTEKSEFPPQMSQIWAKMAGILAVSERLLNKRAAFR
jgi:hypothetical protein